MQDLINKGILIGVVLLATVAITWLVQDWRYGNKIKEIEISQLQEKEKIQEELMNKLITSQKEGIRLSDELIKAKRSKAFGIKKLKDEINELKNNVPPSCQFNDDWLRIYNSSYSVPKTNTTK